MKQIKTVLSIAGSDSCGGAGLQADIKTISSIGLYAAACVTAVTAQNTLGVRGIEAVSPAMLSAQIEAVLEDLHIDAIKIGMIYNSENVTAIRESLQKCGYQGPIVLDPVLVATSGDFLSEKDLVESMKRELFPMATVVTPNIPEAEVLSGVGISSLDDMRKVAKTIISETGVRGVLVKGGHGIVLGNEMTDFLVCASGLERLFTKPWVNSRNTHGTGCTLSSAIAAFLARKFPLEKAVQRATTYVHITIDSAKDMETGHGHGSLNHLFHPKRMIMLEK